MEGSNQAWYANKVLLVLFILFLPPLGLYFVFKLGMGTAWKVAAGVMSFIFVLAIFGKNEEGGRQTEREESLPQTPVANGYDTARVREAFLAFENSYSELDRRGVNAFENYQKVFKNAKNYSVVELYNTVKNTHRQIESVWMDCYKLEVPTLPSSIAEKADLMKENLQMSYYMKKEALEKAMKILDGGGKPSEISAMQDDINAAQSYLFRSAAFLVEIRAELKIN